MSDREPRVPDYLAEHWNVQDYIISTDELHEGHGNLSKRPSQHLDPDECPMSGCHELMVYVTVGGAANEKSCPVHGKESRVFEQMGLTASGRDPEADQGKEQTAG